MRPVLWLWTLVFAVGCVAADLDHDGIPDEWEAKGVTVTFADGHTRFLDLPAMGASPRHKDVIVWIVWMDAPDHSHRPVANTHVATDGSGLAIEQVPLGRIVQAYRNAPVANIDGTTGINLILIYSDMPPISEVTPIGTTDPLGNYDWKPLEDLARPQIPNGPSGIESAIHTCYFVHQMGGEGFTNSGLSKGIPGLRFLVSLGALDSKIGSADEQAGTFMHELGHNFGLNHGGADDIRNKPNYLSVLNYLFQVTGLMIDGTLGHFDYSRQKFDFNEHAVNGSLGVSQDQALTRYGSAEICESSNIRFFPKLSTPIRWDCTENDPEPGTHAKDVNRNGDVELLGGWNDWESIKLAPFTVGAGAPIVKTPKPANELDVRRIASILGALMVPRLTVEKSDGGLHVAWARVPLDSVVAYEVLRSRPGSPSLLIWQTKRTDFLDTTAVPGVTYNYQVRLVVNGFSSGSIDQVIEKIGRVEKLPVASILSVLPQKRSISEVLMRAQPSRVVQAIR